LTVDQSADDVVVISGPSLQKQIADKHLQMLDKSRLPAAKALWPEIAGYLAIYDPGNLYAVNYMWFTMGLTFNAKIMQERHEEASLTSWDAIFRPDILKKFADCGVEVQDSPNDVFAIALHYLRSDARSRSPVELKRAADLLFALRRNVKRFRPPGDLSNMASGDVCLTLGWSGDAAQARKEAKDSDSGVTIAYATPKGGTLLLLDNLAIPKNAPHRDAAYALINYLVRPDIAARNTKMTHFANGDLTSKAFLPPEILDDPSIYPDAAAMKTFFTPGIYGPQEQALITREWTRVKTGK
jgi:putrescine transport system substrate-binding protein